MHAQQDTPITVLPVVLSGAAPLHHCSAAAVSLQRQACLLYILPAVEGLGFRVSHPDQPPPAPCPGQGWDICNTCVLSGCAGRVNAALQAALVVYSGMQRCRMVLCITNLCIMLTVQD